MTAGELKAFLFNIPDDTHIAHEDSNFGGVLSYVEIDDLTLTNGLLLIREPIQQVYED